MFKWTKIRKQFLPSSELLKNFLTLFSGATLGQIIPFLAGPLLSRLYSPEDFGLFALLSSVSGLASIVATGTYEVSILTSENEEEAESAFLLSTILTLLFSSVSAIIILVMVIIANPWATNSLGWIWLLTPLFILFTGLLNSTSYRLNRQKRYGKMATGKIIRSIAMTVAQLILALGKFQWGLFPGMLVGQISSSSYQLSSVKENLKKSIKAISYTNLKAIAIKHKRFPLFLLPAQLTNELSVQVPIYMLKMFFTTSIVGLYALPQKFLNIPVVLIGNSMGQVFFQKAAELKDDRQALAQTTLSLFRFLFRIGVVPFSIILVFGDYLFSWAFGGEWLQSGVFAQMLSPWLLFVLSGSPISKLFTVQNRQEQSLYFNLSLLSLRVLGLLSGALFFKSEVMAVLLFGVTSFSYWVFLTFFILRIANVNVLKALVETFVTWLLVLTPLALIRFIFF